MIGAKHNILKTLLEPFHTPITYPILLTINFYNLNLVARIDLLIGLSINLFGLFVLGVG